MFFRIRMKKTCYPTTTVLGDVKDASAGRLVSGIESQAMSIRRDSERVRIENAPRQLPRIGSVHGFNDCGARAAFKSILGKKVNLPRNKPSVGAKPCVGDASWVVRIEVAGYIVERNDFGKVISEANQRQTFRLIAPLQLTKQILSPDAEGARQEYCRNLDCGSHLPLMPDQRGIHQIVQIPGLVEIQVLRFAFDLQHWIRFDLRAQILA